MGNLRIKTIVALCAIMLLCYVSLFAPEMYFWISVGITLPVFTVCALLNQKEDGITQPFDKMAHLFIGLATTLFCCLIVTILTFIIIAAIAGITMPETTIYLFTMDVMCFIVGMFMVYMHMELESHDDQKDDKEKL